MAARGQFHLAGGGQFTWVFQLDEPVVIKCQVNGKPLIAEILEQTNDQ